MVQEQRRHPRSPLSLEVTLHHAGRDTPGTTVDASLGGAFVTTALVAPFGVELEITLPLPGLGAVRVPATVRWSRDGGLGLQFGLMGARETHALSSLVSPSSTT